MKRKCFLWRKIRVGALIAFASLFLYSCAEDGFTEETFTSDVWNSQLESPKLDSACFATKVASDGSDQVQVSWKVVHGAGGYEYEVQNVDDPNNPVKLLKDTVDGTSFLFAKSEDTNYKVSVRSLGNAAYNNTAATTATDYTYSTLVSAQIIPVGTEISAFIKEHLLDVTTEQAFELEAGGEYALDGDIDFADKKVTFRGNKITRPIVTFGANGVIRTSAGLKIKFINFDCTAQTNKGGVVELSSTPPSSVTGESLGIKNGKDGAVQKCYYLLDPIIFQDCAFKNVTCCLFTVGQCSWGVSDVRVNDCIVQLNNNGTAWSNGSIISGFSHSGTYEGTSGVYWYGGIKDITVKNSTLYNIVSNGSNRFVRFNNNTLDRVFSTADGSATITNCTLYKVFDNKEFANNTPNQAKYVITFKNNICYDVFRLQKFIQGNCNTTGVDMKTNTIWGIVNPVDATDKSKWATEENAAFSGVVNQALDFTKSDFGIDFKATGAISSTIGDPRWLTSE